MNRVLLDTDVASYLFKDPSFTDVLEECDGCLSFMSVAELRAWALMANWGVRRTAMLDQFIRRFEIIHSDDDICSLWAELRAEARSRGREISPQDAWIAATAIALDAPLATNNRRDYDHIDGLNLLDL